MRRRRGEKRDRCPYGIDKDKGQKGDRQKGQERVYQVHLVFLSCLCLSCSLALLSFWASLDSLAGGSVYCRRRRRYQRAGLILCPFVLDRGASSSLFGMSLFVPLRRVFFVSERRRRRGDQVPRLFSWEALEGVEGSEGG